MRSTLLVFAAVALAACQKPAPAPVDHTADAIAAVKAADAAWLKVFAGRDTAAAVGMIEATGSMMGPNAPIATGPEAIKAMFAGFYALPGMTIAWEATRADAAASGDLAYTSGNYTLTFKDPKAGTITDKGKYVTVWHKQGDGSWKVALDIFNSDLPAAH